MKFNGATFNKAQQDQLKKKIGADLEDVIKKVDDVDSRMLNYTGDWVTDNEYHENDVVTWAHDGHLYEVIKAHTSSSTINPSNTEYYKAMTAKKIVREDFSPDYSQTTINRIKEIVKKHPDAVVGMLYSGTILRGDPFVDDFDNLKIFMAGRGLTGAGGNYVIIGNAFDKGQSYHGGMPFRGVLIDVANTPNIYNINGSDTDLINFGVQPRFIIYSE